MTEWAKLARVGGSTSAVSSSLLGSFISGAHIFDHVVVSVISFCLFCGGMIMNDLLDVEKDKQLRPGRPLASGSISTSAVKKVLWSLITITLAMGVLLKIDQFITILITWLTIYGYNGPFKKNDLLSGFSLATARASNFLIGLSITAGILEPILFIPALALFLHTISILIFSKGEDLAGPIPKGAWITQILIFLILIKWSLLSAGLWIIAVLTILYQHKDHGRMKRIKGVGWMVNAFCLLDASVLASTRHLYYVPIWLVLLFIGRFISRRFPAG